jgi:hypothetical protein
MTFLACYAQRPASPRIRNVPQSARKPLPKVVHLHRQRRNIRLAIRVPHGHGAFAEPSLCYRQPYRKE